MDNKFAAGIGLFITKDNKVLLLHRTNTKNFSGLYAIPGGTVEKGESITDACLREAEEELGLKVKKSDLKFLKASHIKP